MEVLSMRPRKQMDFWKYDDKGYVIAGTINGTYELDEISTYIWEKCDGHNTVKEIIQDLAKACNMEDSIEVIKNDVLNLLEEWNYNQLIIKNYNPLHSFSEYNEDKLYDIEIENEEVDVLLIAPPSPNPTTGMNVKIQGTFPVGIGYISAYLKQHGYKVEVLNLWLKEVNEITLRNIISKANPKILGVSSMTDNFLNGVTIAKIAKEIDENIVTIFGGPHVTFTDKESLENYDSIDLIVRNEGEYTVLELADLFIKNKGNIEDIKGITYRRNNEIIRNQRREMIQDLDSLPIPDRSGFDFANSMVGVQTSRGCPGACIFCVASTMAGGKYRVRSAENVVKEIEYLYNKGARSIFFQDDTFTADLGRLREILSLIKSKGLDIDWSAESRVDIVDSDPDIFKEMKECGCSSLQFGVESGSQESLDNLKKKINVDQIFRAITTAKESGLNVICTMLIGHPFDNEQSILDSIKFAEKLIDLGAFVLFSIVCPYPGTQIRNFADKYNIKIHETSYNDYFVSNAFVDTANLTAKKIRNLYFDGMKKIIYLNLNQGIDKFVGTKKLNA